MIFMLEMDRDARLTDISIWNPNNYRFMNNLCKGMYNKENVDDIFKILKRFLGLKCLLMFMI
jgi:hypothetical protein